MDPTTILFLPEKGYICTQLTRSKRPKKEKRGKNNNLTSRWQKGNPSKQILFELRLNPMNQERNVQNKRRPPPTKRRPNIPENPIIPNIPDVPACQENHLREERLSKIPSSMIGNGNHIISSHPVDLKIIPDPTTEVTLKE